jgi:hypothetical protein
MDFVKTNTKTFLLIFFNILIAATAFIFQIILLPIRFVKKEYYQKLDGISKNY